MSQRWWEKWPERLGFELKELSDQGIKYEIDNAAKEAGKLVLVLEHTLDGESLRLVAKFPDNYPYFRFEVSAPELSLSRHQNPYGKNLCLIGRTTANWNPKEDTLARFIVDQLPKVIESAHGGGEELEEKQGEPISEYYPYFGRMVLVDSSWKLDPATTGGTLEIGLNNNTGTARMAIASIVDTSGDIIAEAHPAIKDWYKNRIKVEWVRIEEAIKTVDPREFLDKLFQIHPHLKNLTWRRDLLCEQSYAIVGVMFPEEVGYKKMGDGWIFVVIYKKKVRKGKKKKWHYSYTYARAGRAGPEDMMERIPHLSFLSGKKIAVIGLGSIGAPSALEFAKNGVSEIRLLDGDYVDPGTIVRWPLGYFYISGGKEDALNHFISQNYPYTKVLTQKLHIGATDDSSQNEILEKFLDGVDLIYDATAELGVHHLLADYAREVETPYVLASATPGAWGGFVARFIPGGPCWACFERARTENKIPLPPDKPDGKVQPVGCGNPTFTGASFDLQEVALAGVRLAVSTLSPVDKYGNVEWDAANLSFREGDKFLLPTWTPLSVDKYPDCICVHKK